MPYKALDKELIGKWVLCSDAGAHVRMTVWEKERRVFNTQQEAERAKGGHQFACKVASDYPLMEVRSNGRIWPIR